MISEEDVISHYAQKVEELNNLLAIVLVSLVNLLVYIKRVHFLIFLLLY